MRPTKRDKAKQSNLDESIAYDKIKNDRLDNLVMLYDEATVLLFEKPEQKRNIKKI